MPGWTNRRRCCSLLRGVNHEELVDVTAAVTDVAKAGTSRRRIAATGIADVFGIDLAETGEGVSGGSEATPAKKSKPKKVTLTSANQLVIQPPVRWPHTKTTPASITKGRKKSTDVAPFPDPLTGDAIYAWRSSLGETQAVFAARIGITAASISQWEKKGNAAIRMQSRTLLELGKAWKLTHY